MSVGDQSWGVLYCEDSARCCGQYPREGPQESFYRWQMGGWNPRGGMPFRGDSNTHAIETPMDI
jgi:hypothetical protein